MVLLGRQAFDRRCRRSQARGLSLRTDRQAFSVDKLDVFDSHEAQEVAYVAGLCIKRGAGVQAPARGKDIGPLALQQPHRTVRGIAEGLPGAGNMVEVSL